MQRPQILRQHKYSNHNWSCKHNFSIHLLYFKSVLALAIKDDDFAESWLKAAYFIEENIISIYYTC